MYKYTRFTSVFLPLYLLFYAAVSATKQYQVECAKIHDWDAGPPAYESCHRVIHRIKNTDWEHQPSFFWPLIFRDDRPGDCLIRLSGSKGREEIHGADVFWPRITFNLERILDGCFRPIPRSSHSTGHVIIPARQWTRPTAVINEESLELVMSRDGAIPIRRTHRISGAAFK
jgi:hypothetical protein